MKISLKLKNYALPQSRMQRWSIDRYINDRFLSQEAYFFSSMELAERIARRLSTQTGVAYSGIINDTISPIIPD